MINSISEIKPGHIVEIESDKGGCDKAPCTKVVNNVSTNNTFTSTDDDDRGYSFQLNMDNYLGTIDVAPNGDIPAKTIHSFSQ